MPSQPPIPPLDSSLAADCKPLPIPPDGDYDDLTGWVIDVIGLYGECAARHRTVVNMWLKMGAYENDLKYRMFFYRQDEIS